MNKKLIAPIVAIIVGGTTLAGAQYVSAQEILDPHVTIVQRLAQRFGLQENDVQAVFNEVHQEREAEMKAALEERLAQAVTDGKITEAQKQAILDKIAEEHQSRQFFKVDLRNMTQEERQAEMEKHRSEMQQRHQELETWATEQGIDLETLKDIFPMRGNIMIKRLR